MKFLKKFTLLTALLMFLCLAFVLASCENEPENPTPPAHTHAFGEWQTVSEPTCALQGVKKQTCSCGVINTAVMDKLTTHTFTDGVCIVCGYECPHTDASATLCEDCGAEAMTYTVTLKDGWGEPVSAFIYMNRDGEQKAFAINDPNSGTATFNLLAGTYSFTVASMTGTNYAYDETRFVVSAANPNVTVNLYSAFGDRTEIYSSFETDEQLYAQFISTGNNYSVPYTADSMSYFIFTAEKTGVYRISFVADDDVSVGYYGNPYFVLKNDVTKDKDRVDAYTILVDIAPSHIPGQDREASNFVIGTKGLSASGTGVLIVERIAEHETTPDDLPFEPFGDNVTPLFFTPDGAELPGFALTDLDITSSELQIVFNESDGFYHYMTADGPIVLVKLDIPSAYLEVSFAEMCKTQAFNCYLYNEDGSFKEKVTYQTMMLRYIDACSVANGGLGVYPLDNNIITAIKNVGGFRGWYELSADSNRHIFGDKYNAVVPENAWMFALCYAEIKPVEHKVTVKNSGGDPISGVTVTVTDDEGAVITSAVTDENGVAALTFKHVADCYITLDEQTLNDYTLPEATLKLDGKTLTITLTAASQDGGDSLPEYDPELKYAQYNWNETNIKIQISEYSGKGEFSSLYRRHLAGETLYNAEIDTLISARNTKARTVSRVAVEYIYVTDSDAEYAWGSAGSMIKSKIFSLGSDAPDVFCHSAEDLIEASLGGCFFNMKNESSVNNLSFLEAGYSYADKPYGYREELMDSFSLSPKKRYILASDYLIDTVRGLNVIPVKLSLLNKLSAANIVPDINENEITDAEDLHRLVTEGKWSFYTLAALCSAMNERLADSSGIVLDVSNKAVASALLFSADFDIFSRTLDKESGEYSTEILDTGMDFSEFSTTLGEILEYRGVNSESTDSKSIRERFTEDGLLFGGIVPIGALESAEYSSAAADGIYIAPVPKLSAEASYRTALDLRARLAAVNSRSEKIAQTTAFLDAQTTGSEGTLEAYLLYGLLWDGVGASQENREALELLRSSFTPSFTASYDCVIDAYFKNTDSALRGKSWQALFAESALDNQNPESIFTENAEKRLAYIEKLAGIVSRFD